MGQLSSETWKRINELFHRAVELDPQGRLDLLESETRGQPEVRRELEGLLSSVDQDDDFLEKPPVAAIPAKSAPPEQLREGSHIADFVVLKVLGRGSFATVYLCHQLSLNRKVALKVSRNLGEEARNMAHLEHDNIVKVFSETIDAGSDLRLLCMQLVPGTSLEAIFEALRNRKPGRITGATLLEIIDAEVQQESAFNPAALKDRERLASFDAVEAAIWMGVRLADALAYAHDREVLHLDVKPGNILVTAYGRPMLTDFNISVDRRAGAKGPRMLGGTARYMSPEQQALFETPDPRTALAAIDRRADIFSLGVVIRETVTRFLGNEAIFPELDRVLSRCTAPDPAARFESASDVAKALEGCLELRDIRKTLPPEGPVARLTRRSPWWSALVFIVGPQLLGSAVNISYNSMRIVGELTPGQKDAFRLLVVLYNIVVYPLCTWLVIARMAPVLRYLRTPRAERPDTTTALRHLRRRALRIPAYVVAGTTLGWMPGSLIFPLGIHLLAGSVSPAVFGHFFVSFSLSWLVALAYSFLYTQFVAVRVYYPELCPADAGTRKRARMELRVVGPAIRLIHFTAGFVPLIGAALVVYVGPDRLDPAHYNSYRTLVTLLIGCGMVGLAFALRATGLLAQTVFALTGSDKPA